MPVAKQKQKFRISFNLGFRESLGVILCAILFLIGPIVVIEYTKQLNPAVTETYTQDAINNAQGEGHVAGVSTSTVDQKYFTIPFINFKFDKTLSDSSSVLFLFGVMLLIGGITLGVTIIASSNKKMFVRKN